MSSGNSLVKDVQVVVGTVILMHILSKILAYPFYVMIDVYIAFVDAADRYPGEVAYIKAWQANDKYNIPNEGEELPYTSRSYIWGESLFNLTVAYWGVGMAGIMFLWIGGGFEMPHEVEGLTYVPASGFWEHFFKYWLSNGFFLGTLFFGVVSLSLSIVWCSFVHLITAHHARAS